MRVPLAEVIVMTWGALQEWIVRSYMLMGVKSEDAPDGKVRRGFDTNLNYVSL
jgi:hypothetical protein